MTTQESIKDESTQDVTERTVKRSIRTYSFSEVDEGLTSCEKLIKSHTETVKAKLNGSSSIPSDVLRELSKANNQKSQLTMRRIALLIETGDAAVMDLVDKLCKLKPAKA